MTKLTIAKGINAGLRRAMENDPKVVLMGEDIGKLGGVFRVTEGLQKDFGEDRVIDTPLAESGIVGTAVGMALRGYRPVVEIQFDGFVYPAFDQIVCQVAKMRARSLGQVKIPMVIRIPVGGGIGAVEHHSESNEAYFAHTAGLRVVACSNPEDAYWMIQQAIETDDPVIFYEPKRRYQEKAEVDQTAGATRGLYEAAVLREGEHVTARGVRADGQDLPGRGHGRGGGGPLARGDRPALAVPARPRHARRVGRARPAGWSWCTRRRPSSAWARRSRPPITQRCFYSLEAPVLRVGGYNLPYPPSRLEEEFLPDLDRVLDAVDRSLAY